MSEQLFHGAHIFLRCSLTGVVEHMPIHCNLTTSKLTFLVHVIVTLITFATIPASTVSITGYTTFLIACTTIHTRTAVVVRAT